MNGKDRKGNGRRVVKREMMENGRSREKKSGKIRNRKDWKRGLPCVRPKKEGKDHREGKRGGQ